jgi:hypothetical protein
MVSSSVVDVVDCALTSLVIDYTPQPLFAQPIQMFLEATVLGIDLLSCYPKCITLSINYKY